MKNNELFEHIPHFLGWMYCKFGHYQVTIKDTTPPRDSPNTVLMLGQRLRRWPNIEPALEKCTVFETRSSCPANKNICITFIQRRPNVFDVGQTLYKVIQMFCVPLGVGTSVRSNRFEIPTVIQSVCLQSKAQLRSRTKGFEI